MVHLDLASFAAKPTAVEGERASANFRGSNELAVEHARRYCRVRARNTFVRVGTRFGGDVRATGATGARGIAARTVRRAHRPTGTQRTIRGTG